MYKSILLSIIIIANLGCDAKSDSEVQVNPPNNTSKQVVSFDEKTNQYSHSFSMNIDQPSGKLDYYINTSSIKNILLKSSHVQVYGCDSSQVKAQLVWMPLGDESSLGREIKVGDQVYTVKNKTGSFRYLLDGLSGCTRLEIQISLEQYSISSTIGNSCNFTEGCRIVSECRRVIKPSELYEKVVIYSDVKNQLTVRHSMVSIPSYDETLNSVFEATKTETDQKFIFTKPFFKESFSINKLTYDGAFDYGSGSGGRFTECFIE